MRKYISGSLVLVSYDSSETALFGTIHIKLLWIVGQELSCMCLLISFMHV